MKIKMEIFLVTFFSLALTTAVHALDSQGWIKKLGQKKMKGRNSTQKHTSVAAVRGIEEPSQVDLGARNYEAVKEMEKRNIPKERIILFIKEGQLVLQEGETGK